ncbi:MAG TPA: Crp/Fnr family transcriptional regulator [Tianweitania sediminis]|nr:Crp/Fnr family transcriptional regulator [Tianweitania sediminis]
MPNAFVRKLGLYADLSPEDTEHLTALTKVVRDLGPNEDLIREGDTPENVHLVLNGLAVRHKTTVDGTRQIAALLLPGDFCDLHIAILDTMDHSISTLAPTQVVDIPRKTILDLVNNHPTISKALLSTTLVDEAILREWLVNLGARRSEIRIAHLFCELHARMQAIGLASNGTFSLPITQAQLGEALGLSTVHVNRSLMALKDANLVRKHDRQVEILDLDRLHAFAEFDPTYLHFRKAPDTASKSMRA